MGCSRRFAIKITPRRTQRKKEKIFWLEQEKNFKNKHPRTCLTAATLWCWVPWCISRPASARYWTRSVHRIQSKLLRFHTRTLWSRHIATNIRTPPISINHSICSFNHLTKSKRVYIYNNYLFDDLGGTLGKFEIKIWFFFIRLILFPQKFMCFTKKHP